MAIATSALHCLIDPDQQRALNRKLTTLEFRVWASIISLNLAGQYLISNKILADQANIKPQTCVGALRSLESKGAVRRGRSGRGARSVQVLAAESLPVKVDIVLAQARMDLITPDRLVKAFAAVGAAFHPETGRVIWKDSSDTNSPTANPSPKVEFANGEPENEKPIPDTNSSTANSSVSPENPSRKPPITISPSGIYNKINITSSEGSSAAGAADSSAPPPAKPKTTKRAAPGKSAERSKPAPRPNRDGDMGLIRLSGDNKRALIMSGKSADKRKRHRLIQLVAGRVKDKYAALRKAATGQQWYINGKHDPAFMKTAELVLLYGFKIEPFIKWLAQAYSEFVTDVRYPTPRMLHSLEMAERFSLSGPTKRKGADVVAGHSYKHLEEYDTSITDKLLEAGLDLPPAEPSHLRGFLVADLKSEIRDLPGLAGMGVPFHYHSCLIASFEKPAELEAWARKASTRKQWEQVVEMAKKLSRGKRVEMWKPILDIHEEVFGA